MTTLAILPIKTLTVAKQRLADGLDTGSRRALVEAMFSDVLVALRRSTRVDQVLVVTADHGAQRIGEGYGAAVCEDDDGGHNSAAARGITWALEQGIERVLLICGDCPLVDPGELDELIARPAQAPSALIVPDRHDTGTNALLLTPPGTLAPSFGPDSHARYRRHALTAGVAAETVRVPTLALDVDTPEDLEAVQEMLEQRRGGAAHTRGMLRQLMRSRA